MINIQELLEKYGEWNGMETLQVTLLKRILASSP